MKKRTTWTLAIALLAVCVPSQAEPKTAEPDNIWAAAAKGDIEAVTRHLKKGTDINATFVAPGVPGSGGTPLHLAILGDQAEAVKFLIEKGADVNAKAKDASGGPPLHWAVGLGRVGIAKLLIQAGAKVNATDNGRTAALLVAAVVGRTDLAELLLASGADIKSANAEGSTALHAAAFFCRTDTVTRLLKKGADVNAKNRRSETPLDTVAAPWSEALSDLYKYIGNLLKMELDLKRIQAARPKIAAFLRKHGGKKGRKPEEPPRPSRKPARPVQRAPAGPQRGSYAVNGQLHVGTFGQPDGKPLTTGHQDMKPSWSKTGDMLVFFRLVKPAARIPDWKTAICIVKTDGTGFRKLTDGTHTDFNPTWTRDGTNLVVLNRQNKKTGGYVVMFTKPTAKPGEEYAVSDTRIHTYAYSCLQDGRLLVSASGRPGYFLMTPRRDNRATYEALQCELARKGRLDRISISPSETQVCFEHQPGWGPYRYPGRLLYIADFDAEERTITNPKAIANESAERDATFLYPRWTRDESAVVYHHGRRGKNQLYMYRLADGSTTRVSTNPNANYMFPHGEKSPK